MLSILPVSELKRIRDEYIEKYFTRGERLEVRGEV